MTDLIKKYSLDSSTWTYKGFHGVLHTFFPVGQTGPAMKSFFGDGSKITIFFITDDYVHWYWNDNDLTRIREKFLARLKKDKNYLEKLKKEWEIKIKDFNGVIRKIDKINLQKLSNENLSSLYDDFYARYINEFKYFMTIGDAVSMHADRYLVPEFKKVLGNDFTTAFPKLLTTKYLSFIEEEGIEREKLLKTLIKKGSVPNKLLAKHAKNYFYIYNNYAKAGRLTDDDFNKMLNEELEKMVGSAKDARNQQLKEKRKLIRKYYLSSWHKTLLYVMDEFFKIQDTRKKCVLISNYYQFEFLKEAARRSGISFKLLQYSIYPEFRAVLEKKIKRKDLEKRSKICVCIQTPDSFEIVYGSDAQKALDFFQKGVDIKEDIKGMTASVGIARGRVKKILKIHDMANIEKGDILVVSMTRPEMVPAMKLVSAIITDEGGVTSHAAIVSRELGIPCIIGTKIATQMLNDGDIVEINADKGFVKILDKAKTKEHNKVK
jgi:phosphohistidine swiveling domain-containing protein